MMRGVLAAALQAVLLAVVRADSAPCSADELAVYRVYLDTHWSRDLFPKQYPEWRPPAGWSKLVGRTHDASFWLFREGELASAGLQAFAEKGQSDALDDHAGDAGVYDEFTAPAVPRGVGRTLADFFLDGNHSLVSVAARVVPSPDWFVGVDSLDLCRNGNWIDSIAIEDHVAKAEPPRQLLLLPQAGQAAVHSHAHLRQVPAERKCELHRQQQLVGVHHVYLHDYGGDLADPEPPTRTRDGDLIVVLASSDDGVQTREGPAGHSDVHVDNHSRPPAFSRSVYFYFAYVVELPDKDLDYVVVLFHLGYRIDAGNDHVSHDTILQDAVIHDLSHVATNDKDDVVIDKYAKLDFVHDGDGDFTLESFARAPLSRSRADSEDDAHVRADGSGPNRRPPRGARVPPERGAVARRPDGDGRERQRDQQRGCADAPRRPRRRQHRERPLADQQGEAEQEGPPGREALPGVRVVALVGVQRVLRRGRRDADAEGPRAPAARRTALPGPAGAALVRRPQRMSAELLQLVTAGRRHHQGPTPTHSSTHSQPQTRHK